MLRIDVHVARAADPRRVEAADDVKSVLGGQVPRNLDNLLQSVHVRRAANGVEKDRIEWRVCEKDFHAPGIEEPEQPVDRFDAGRVNPRRVVSGGGSPCRSRC